MNHKLRRKLAGMQKRHRTIAAILGLHGSLTAQSIDGRMSAQGFGGNDTYINRTAIAELVKAGVIIEERGGERRRYRLADGMK
jgi:DNA-binding transcriptional regulator PaaX